MERLFTRSQRRAPILVPEKRGVGHARANNPLVAGANLVRVFTLEVGYEHEAWQQLTLAVCYRKVALVPGQRRHDALARQSQILFVEAPGHRDRPFDERRDFVVERFAVDYRAAGGLRFGLGALANEIPPPGEVGDDMPLFLQHLEIFGRLLDNDGFVRVKTVPARFVAGVNPHHFGIDDVISVQQHDPVHRADELRLARAPPHAARNGQ